MSEEGEDGGERTELYVRSLLPDSYSQRQNEIVARVERLVDRGVLTERTVQPCGHQLPATSAEANTDVGEWFLDRFSSFREWASVNGCDLAPAFGLREVNDTLTETRYRALRPPAILLAEYRAGAIVCVTPHRDGETVRTVRDRISELETGTPTAFEPVTVGAVERGAAPLVHR